MAKPTQDRAGAAAFPFLPSPALRDGRSECWWRRHRTRELDRRQIPDERERAEAARSRSPRITAPGCVRISRDLPVANLDANDGRIGVIPHRLTEPAQGRLRFQHVPASNVTLRGDESWSKNSFAFRLISISHLPSLAHDFPHPTPPFDGCHDRQAQISSIGAAGEMTSTRAC